MIADHASHRKSGTPDRPIARRPLCCAQPKGCAYPDRPVATELHEGRALERPDRRPGRAQYTTEAMPVSKPAPPVDLVIERADRCVQCGLCLPHCPTYALTRSEAESPRGRIAIARGLASGLLSAAPEADAALDHCLGCLRCETVCPAHVDYRQILLQTRARQRQRRSPGLRQRMLEWLTAHPHLLELGLRLGRHLAPWLPHRLRRWLPSESTRAVPPRTTAAPATAAAPDTRVAVFAGCVARAHDDELHASLDRLLHAVGLIPARPPAQTCCGALHMHAGNMAVAHRLAAHNRAAFANADSVLTTATGCHATLAQTLEPGTRVRDALETLAERASSLQFRASDTIVALHTPCTQGAHAAAALRSLLSQIPGSTWVELRGSGCCGAAGTHMLEQPERAARLRQPLLDQARQAGASIMVSANIGCRLHLAAGTDIEVVHPIVFLARHLI